MLSDDSEFSDLRFLMGNRTGTSFLYMQIMKKNLQMQWGLMQWGLNTGSAR